MGPKTISPSYRFTLMEIAHLEGRTFADCPTEASAATSIVVVRQQNIMLAVLDPSLADGILPKGAQLLLQNQ